MGQCNQKIVGPTVTRDTAAYIVPTLYVAGSSDVLIVHLMRGDAILPMGASRGIIELLPVSHLQDNHWYAESWAAMNNSMEICTDWGDLLIFSQIVSIERTSSCNMLSMLNSQVLCPE